MNKYSRERYIEAYDKFKKWRMENNLGESLSEDTFLQFFNELSQKLRPPSLWFYYSTLKGAIIEADNINIQDYMKLKSFLRKLSIGYQSKKSKVFTAEEVDTFLNEAPDNEYLAVKVALIFGICGGCSRNNFLQIKTDDVTKHDQLFLVKLPPSKHISGQTEQAFVIRENLSPLVQKYIELRPENPQTNRFFLRYANGKCIRQVIGTQIFGSMPKAIATYLNLPNPDKYTGHCFRRTSQKLRYFSGSELALIKRLSERNLNDQSGSLQDINIIKSIDPVIDKMGAHLESATSPTRNIECLSNQQSGDAVRFKALQLWEELTDLLNNGTVERSKTERQWRKVWIDLKHSTKRKVVMLNENPSVQLTDFDLRVLKIIEKESNTKKGAEFNEEKDLGQTSNRSPLLTDNLFAKDGVPNVFGSASLNLQTGVFESKDNDSDDDKPIVKKPKVAPEMLLKTNIKVRKDVLKRDIRLEIEQIRKRQRETELQLQGEWNELMKEGMRVLNKYLGT